MSVSGIGGTGALASTSVASARITTGTTAAGKPLSAQDQAQMDALKKRDSEVKAHEKAHQTAGGTYAGAATYTYQQGPDGKKYAVGGEVSIDASPIRNDPKATITKMQTVERAALAPAQPSSQDMHVAAEAANAISQAQTDAAKAASTGSSGGAGSSSGQGQTQGASDIAGTTATAVVAQDGGGTSLRALLARGIAAYGAAAGLAGGGALSSQFAAIV